MHVIKPAVRRKIEDHGLSVAEVVEAVGFIKENLRIISATFAALDPTCDPHGKTLEAGLKLVGKIISGG